MVFDIGVAYKEDTDKVVEVTRDVASSLQQDESFGSKILEPIEVFGVDSFGDSAVVIKARLKAQPIEQWTVGREYLRRLKKAFDAQGIEIPFPHRTLYFGEASPPFQTLTSSATSARAATQSRRRRRRPLPVEPGHSAMAMDDAVLDTGMTLHAGGYRRWLRVLLAWAALAVRSTVYSSVMSLNSKRYDAASGTEMRTLGPPPVVGVTVPEKPCASPQSYLLQSFELANLNSCSPAGTSTSSATHVSPSSCISMWSASP